MQDIFDINISSALSHLKETINTVLAQVKNKNPYIQNEDCMDLRLIFTELLVNAIIHGNSRDIQKKVHITIELTEECLTSKISDEGNGFNYKEVLNPKRTDNDFLSDTGRGIILVNSLTDELVFNGKGNEIKFVKKFSCIPNSQNNI